MENQWLPVASSPLATVSPIWEHSLGGRFSVLSGVIFLAVHLIYSATGIKLVTLSPCSSSQSEETAGIIEAGPTLKAVLPVLSQVDSRAHRPVR